MDASTDRENGHTNEASRGEIVGRDSASSGPSGGADPFAIMRRVSDEMDRMMRRFGVIDWIERLDAPRFLPNLRDEIFGGRSFPQIEIVEHEGELVVRVDLPGIRREDVSVEAEENAITIRGERREQHDENRSGYYHSERRYGSFERHIPLPEGSDLENAKAIFRDGVLEITMPAPQRGGSARRIEIA